MPQVRSARQAVRPQAPARRGFARETWRSRCCWRFWKLSVWGDWTIPSASTAFVLGTCRNIALEARRADRRAAPTEPAELDLVAVLPETDMIDIEAMHRCLGGLDVRARAVLHLSFTREKSADDIARTLETTPGNVRVLRHRALAQLRRCLDGETEVAP